MDDAIKVDRIAIRVTPAERRALLKQATAEGHRGIGPWLRALGLREAARMEREAKR